MNDAPHPSRTAVVDTDVRTFLIADVRSYTRFTLEHGDAAAARLAMRFAELARGLLEARSGRVLGLRGDEIVAVFTSTRQALWAAAEMQGRFAAEVAADPTLPLRVGIGIDAGEAIPVEDGYRGMALNLAARLCSLAAPGEVLISETVAHLARKMDGLHYVDRGMADLKGFIDPVKVMALEPIEPGRDRTAATAREETGGLPANDAGSTSAGVPAAHAALPIGRFLGSLPSGRLVARDPELRRVLGAVDAVAAGEGRVVLLSGEPGVGKTRLAQEATLAARAGGMAIATGRCYEPEQSVPYFAVLDALVDLLRAAPPEILNEIPTRWPFLNRLLPDRVRLTEPLDSGGQDEELLLFRAVTGFLEALARRTPVALMLDDLHWADSSTLKLLLYLARHTHSMPVFLLGTYRDVEVGRQHPLEGALRDLDREGLIERIQIRRLDEGDTAALVAELMGESDVSEEFATLVHVRTEGNPFFVQQVLRVMVERGDVFQQDGRWDRKSVAEIEVPESIRSVVGQRLSRLLDEAQDVLRVASVLGQSFQFDDLLGMTELGEVEQEAQLENAAAAGLLQTADGESYSFDHALTQQTLYAELPARRRRRLHGAAAAAIERLPERTRERRVAELAWHFIQADDAERALLYSLRAGDAAMAVFAWSEAEMQFRTAAELARELGDYSSDARASRKLGDLLASVGRLGEAIDALERSAQAHRDAANIEGEARAVVQISHAHHLRGATKESVSRLQRLLDEHAGDPASPALALVSACRDWSSAWLRAGNKSLVASDLLDAAERWVRCAEQLDDRTLLAFGTSVRGVALRMSGRQDDTLRDLKKGLALAEVSGDPLSQLFCADTLAETYLFSGEWSAGREASERAYVAAERMRNVGWMAFTGAHIGWALMNLGDRSGARLRLEAAAAIARSGERSWFSAYPFIRLAELCIVEGEWDEAAHLADEASSAAREIDDPQFIKLADALLKRLELARDS